MIPCNRRLDRAIAKAPLAARNHPFGLPRCHCPGYDAALATVPRGGRLFGASTRIRGHAHRQTTMLIGLSMAHTNRQGTVLLAGRKPVMRSSATQPKTAALQTRSSTGLLTGRFPWGDMDSPCVITTSANRVVHQARLLPMQSDVFRGSSTF